MARPKSPCGTYAAYQRHLRERSPVDAACQRAQQERDGSRGKRLRAGDVAAPAPVSDPVRQRRDAVRARFLASVHALAEAVAAESAETGTLFDVIDVACGLDGVLDEWCAVHDDLEYERGYPNLSEDLRVQLLSSRSPA